MGLRYSGYDCPLQKSNSFFLKDQEQDVAAFEDIQCRRSVVSDTLQLLTDQANQWRSKIDLLEAGQHLDRGEALASLGQLLDVCQNLRYAVLSEDCTASWTTKEELHGIVDRIDDAAGKRRRYLDLAQALSSGTISHRRERTKQERLKQRDAAVAELMEVSAQPAPPDLPGPAIDKWLDWAVNLEEGKNDQDLEALQKNFPRLDDFVGQLEIEAWQAGAAPSAPSASEPVALAAAATAPESKSAAVTPAEPAPAAELKTKTSTSAVEAPAAIETAVIDAPVVEEPVVEEEEAAPVSSAVEPATAPAEIAVPEAKPEVKSEADAEVKAEAKSDVKTEVKSEAKVVVKSEASAEDKVDDKTVEEDWSATTESGKLCFFPPDEVGTFVKNLAEGKDSRKVRGLLAISHWLTPADQNPVLHASCGMRAQLGYTGSSDLLAVAPEAAQKAIDSDNGVLLFTGGADLLRWGITQKHTDERITAIASVRRLTKNHIKAWFKDLHRIELAEPQMVDMYNLTHGVPLLVGELHRLVIPDPKTPPTWLGFMIWTTIKTNFERRLPVVARELRNGSAGVRLTEREIRVLKMVTIASDNSTSKTLGSNLQENWDQYHRPELEALSASDEDSVAVLEGLGLLPARRDLGLSPIEALMPLGPGDPLRQIVSYL
jgi:hypothetical protein